jgi:flavin reductase (DIM6/NTAB) family NADH-FMN oxidoreductase RutF
MGTIPQAREILKRMLPGLAKIPSKVDLGLQYPQSEVDVWLHGLRVPLDVTHRHLMACGAPLTLCVGFDSEHSEVEALNEQLTLRFHEHASSQRLLGEIGLRFVSSFKVGTQQLCLFHTTYHKNHCLPRLRLWAQYVRHARSRRKNRARNLDVPITTPEARAMIVFYFCPRPIALVTVEETQARNMFPMNLMGSVGNGYFAFGLNSSRAAAPLVERARRVVLSSVPLEQSSVVSKLGSNHRKSSIDWSQLPFAVVRPNTIDAPVAAFALTVREMQVEVVRPLGSHTLFVAKTIAEERLADGPQLYHVHGIYQARLQDLSLARA